MSKREELRIYLKDTFPKGYIPDHWHPLYLFYNKDKGFSHEILTTGLRGSAYQFHCKYYQSWAEMYDDSYMYFDYRDE